MRPACVRSQSASHVKIGIFDHLSLRLGGSQHVVARMAAVLSQEYDVDGSIAAKNNLNSLPDPVSQISRSRDGAGG